MTIVYPEGPFPPKRWSVPGTPTLPPGQGVNAGPLESQELLDFTAPLGRSTGAYYSLSFQFPKWGYFRAKIEESVFVSPVFREYYEMTVRTKDTLEQTIKAGLASIGTAASDLELVMHDLRKYKEFLDYFTKLDKGKKLMKEGKKEEGENLFNQGDQSLKAVFIDLVDAFTGPTMALREIVVRWPTIIADFMSIGEDDLDKDKIAKKLNVSEAEGVVLATKNKLYLEWRERLFRETVKRRYESLLGMVEARKKSVEEYREMLRPNIARYKMINDALSNPESRAGLFKSFWRPDAQAISIDTMKLWAWKPFAPEEKYKVTRTSFDRISPIKAGFDEKEFNEIAKKLKKQEKLKGIKYDGLVEALPVEPSIDKTVRDLKNKIETEYGVKIDAWDMYRAREMLTKQFRDSMSGIGWIEPWVFSPYYTFFEVPITRTVIRVPPAGPEMENINFSDLMAATQTQNLIIVHCLELIARDKQLDNYIDQMLGKVGSEGKSIEAMVKEEFPEIYVTDEELEEKKKEKPLRLSSSDSAIIARRRFMEQFAKFRKTIGDFLKGFGLDFMFIRAVGPYEFIPNHRLSKYYQPPTGIEFGTVRDFLKSKFEVPGLQVNW